MSSVHFSLTIFGKLPSIIIQIGSTRSWRLLLRLVVIAVFISMPVSHVHGESQHRKFSTCVKHIASKLFQTQSVCTKTDFSIFISYFRIFLKPRRKRQLDLDFPHVPVPCMPWICLSSLEAAEGVLENCWRSNRLSLALATDSE